MSIGYNNSDFGFDYESDVLVQLNSVTRAHKIRCWVKFRGRPPVLYENQLLKIS